jgi:hypothetical protein
MSEDEILSRIEHVLDKVHASDRLIPHPPTPLEALLASEDGEEEEDEIAAARIEAFCRMLDYFFQNGPDPLQVLRNIFAVAKAVRPQVLGDMSMEDISIICADAGRGTVSARIKRIYNAKIEEAGGRPVLSSCQKSGNYSTPQLANKNRKKHGRHHR